MNNIGVTDRRTRIGVGVALIAVGLATLGNLLALGTSVGVVVTLLGLVLVGTGAVGMCPLYRALGIETSEPGQ